MKNGTPCKFANHAFIKTFSYTESDRSVAKQTHKTYLANIHRDSVHDAIGHC